MATYYTTAASKACRGYNIASFGLIQRGASGFSPDGGLTNKAGQYSTFDGVAKDTNYALRIGPWAALVPSQ